jgi:isovaleryl-CoA dehydrogenase
MAATFDLTDEQHQIRFEADRFCRAELGPLAGPMDDDEHWPAEVFPLLGAAGYLGITIPEEYGGQGLSLVEAGLVCEAMAKWNPAIMLSWGAHDNLCANNLYRNGTAAQRRRWLPGLCDGSLVGALGLTEPGAGSDALGAMATTAVPDGDEYVLNGRKLYITNGPIADLILVYAKTEPAAGAKGITAFVVERDAPGFSVAQKLVKMGYRGSQTGELLFDDCRVPADNVVGQVNEGVAVVMSGLDLERAFFAPGPVGIAARCLELSVDHLQTREQFGQPLSSFQALRFKLADMWVGVETARTYAYQVLAHGVALEDGGVGRGRFHAESAAALLYASEVCKRVTDEAVQVHGGAGYIWEMEVNRLYRASKLLEIGAGTNEIRRMIISDELLR